jgi:hypothetical protein
MYVLFIDICKTASGYNSNPTGTVFILVGIGILPKCMFYLLISGRHAGSGYYSNATVFILIGIGICRNACFVLY